MRWGARKQHAAQNARCVREGERERGGKGKGGRAFSFSPFAWLGKLTGKEKPAADKHKHAPACAPKSCAAAPSCLPKSTSPIPAAVAPGRHCSSPPRRSPDADTVPRRLSVGDDNADAVAARRRGQHSRRHCSLGGDRELPPLGQLIPFSSLKASPAVLPPRPSSSAAPSDTDAGPARTNMRRRRRRRRLSNSDGSGRRLSFSGRMAVPLRAAVRVRSPRCAAPPELQRLAVVRRTRDPQRAFRESMVDMVATSGGRPEELERLLACYLSLNADEHHDCIVKVFRQVWFEYINLLPRLDAPRRPRR